jgi:hypothetical protein
MKQAVAHYRNLRHPSRPDPLKLVCFLALIGCGSTEPIEKNLLFEGSITDAATGAAMAGATVFVGVGSAFFVSSVQSTTSDSQGRYVLSRYSCIYNPYLVASATGYSPGQEKVGCQPGSQTVNISLTRDPFAP